jgi:hypothetical protein
MKQQLVASLVLCTLVGCSASPTAPSTPSTPQQTQYTLSAVASPSVGGSVALSPSQAQFASGTSVSLTATAAAGYQFSAWQGDLTGSTNPGAVVTNTNKTVTAVFTATQQQPGLYTLAVYTFPQDAGSVRISPDQAEHNSGTTVTLTASAAPGYRFLQWEGDAYGFDNPTSVVMNANSTATATFVSIQVQPAARSSASTVAAGVDTPERRFGGVTGTARLRLR